MFMSLISHALSAWFAFLLPSFSTYKALSHLPQSEPEVQRWGMYWSVVGAFVAFEYLLEWFISWFPFYWEVKTLFLLYLALPQTQGSTYIYQNYFRPWLAQNERALDDGIVAMQSNAFGFIQEKIGQLLNLAAKNQANNSAQGGQNGQAPAGGNPLATAAGLWQTFGGSVLGALNQHRPQGQAGATGVQANAAPANLTPRGGRSPAASAASTPSMERKDPPFPVPQVPQQYAQGYAQPQGYPQGYSKPY